MRKDKNFWDWTSRSFLAASASILIILFAVAGCSDETATNPIGTNGTSSGDTSEPLDETVFDAYAYVGVEGFSGERADGWSRLAELLGLTDEQTEQMQLAFENFRDALRDLRDQVRQGALTREEAYEQAQLLRAEYEELLQTILTPEQYELLLELRRQNSDSTGPQEAGPHHGQNDNGGPVDHAIVHWEHLAEVLELTDAQSADLAKAGEDLRTELLELQALIRSGELTREEAREQARLLRAEHEATIQSILTEEQYALLLELRAGATGPQGRRPHDG